MNRTEKSSTVQSLNKAISGANTVVITHYTGLTVDEITTLRKKMSVLGAGFRVTKNSLAKLALQDTPYAQLANQFTGPTAIAYSKDPVAAAKGVVEYAKVNDKLVIIGGAIGADIMDVSKIEALAKLPSLDELRAKIVGMIQTPATRIAGIVQAPAGQIARVLNAHSQQG